MCRQPTLRYLAYSVATVAIASVVAVAITITTTTITKPVALGQSAEWVIMNEDVACKLLPLCSGEKAATFNISQRSGQKGGFV